jgi:hypothetical protein
MTKEKWMREFVCLLTPSEEWKIDINGERKNIAVSWLNNKKNKVYKRQEDFKKMSDTYAGSVVVIIEAKTDDDLEWNIIRAIEEIPEEILQVQEKTKDDIFSIVHMMQEKVLQEQQTVWIPAADYYRQQDLIRATNQQRWNFENTSQWEKKKVLPFWKAW